ncbi:MAG: methyltransferase domain-containing protein [Acidimicrobiia bacterium]
MSHPDLPADVQARLAALRTPGSATAPESPPVEPEPVPPVGRRARLKHRVREAAKPVADPALDRLATLVAGRLRHALRSEYDELAAHVELLRAEHALLRGALDSANAFAAHEALPRIDALEVNAELMKGELAAFRASLEQLGQAIAPAAGLAGVPARYAELREQVNALDRRVRATTTTPAAAPAAESAAPAESGAPEPSGGFDYVGFERRFRGDSATVLETLADRYAPILEEHQPVLDFGCGRGELVEVLNARGIAATGVDPDAGMVAEAQGHGRDVRLGDGLAYLRDLPANDLGAVISVHVVEHLPLAVLVELLELAAARLRPGGVFIAETPNPMSLIVLGNSYILDPTHVWPLHPSLLTFLAERAGFRDVELEFYSPAEDYRIGPIHGGPDAPAWLDEINTALERLNDVLFGPQEYALIARTPPA